jgi:hypothetical protein
MEHHHIGYPALVAQALKNAQHPPAMGQLGRQPHFSVGLAQIGRRVPTTAVVPHASFRPWVLAGPHGDHLMANGPQGGRQLPKLAREILMQQQYTQKNNLASANTSDGPGTIADAAKQQLKQGALLQLEIGRNRHARLQRKGLSIPLQRLALQAEANRKAHKVELLVRGEGVGADGGHHSPQGSVAAAVVGHYGHIGLLIGPHEAEILV